MAQASASAGRLSPLFTWRSAVASANGPADFELPVVREGVETTTIVKGPTQRHVALTLSLHMNEKGGSCFPGVARVARESGLSARTVQRSVRALEDGGWLRVQTANAPDGTNLYTATIPPNYLPDDEDEGGVPDTGGGVPGTGEGAYRSPPGGVPGTPEGVTESASEGRKDHDVVCDAWAAHAPPLIRHSVAYFREQKTRRATKSALRVYPVDEVVAAIANHATCLGSDEYRWTYRWTLIDFLKRGLDKFVPEAAPLANFRIRTAGPSTADDFGGMPDFDD